MGLLLVPLFAVIVIVSGFNKEKMIRHKWSDGPLEWAYFEGEDDQSDLSATTCSSIGFNWRYNGKVIIFEAETLFEAECSWVRNHKRSDYLLSHEQKHFDLKEYFTRSLREKLVHHHFQSPETISQEIDSLFHLVHDEERAMQEVYDNETDRSRDVASQHSWNDKIDSLLTSKELYRTTKLEFVPKFK